jgi:DNA-binding HxlR family transcriptional regulator
MQNDTALNGLDRCPVDVTLSAIGGKWKALILYHAISGPRRFNELRRLMPSVTQRMLTQHLRELEADGILHRDVKAQVPPHVEYMLTEKGKTLVPILDAMAQWGAANAAHAASDCSNVA